MGHTIQHPAPKPVPFWACLVASAAIHAAFITALVLAPQTTVAVFVVSMMALAVSVP